MVQIVMRLGPIAFLLRLACLPFFYTNHRSAPLPKKRLSVGQYVFTVFVVGLLAFVVGTATGVIAACGQENAGNLCGLGGFLGTGPLFSALAMMLAAYIVTRRARLSPHP